MLLVHCWSLKVNIAIASKRHNEALASCRFQLNVKNKICLVGKIKSPVERDCFFFLENNLIENALEP